MNTTQETHLNNHLTLMRIHIGLALFWICAVTFLCLPAAANDPPLAQHIRLLSLAA